MTKQSHEADRGRWMIYCEPGMWSRSRCINVLSAKSDFLVLVSAVHGFCQCWFPVTTCLWRSWSILHVIAPHKLTLCVIIINYGRENKCTTALNITCKPILTSRSFFWPTNVSFPSRLEIWSSHLGWWGQRLCLRPWRPLPIPAVNHTKHWQDICDHNSG